MKIISVSFVNVSHLKFKVASVNLYTGLYTRFVTNQKTICDNLSQIVSEMFQKTLNVQIFACSLACRAVQTGERLFGHRKRLRGGKPTLRKVLLTCPLAPRGVLLRSQPLSGAPAQAVCSRFSRLLLLQRGAHHSGQRAEFKPASTHGQRPSSG